MYFVQLRIAKVNLVTGTQDSSTYCHGWKRQGRKTYWSDDYKRPVQTSPGWALALAVFLLSLAWRPTTAGFVAKFYIFRAAIQADLVWLALVGVVTPVISTYHYLRVVYFMFMFEGEVQIHEHMRPWNGALPLCSRRDVVGQFAAQWPV
ncbi:MAG: proton-conducting transporter membrane subunit, partial [Chloroflexi bacterium]|nr:proton-conducting transporter membrane subunit [Chloroflexota bacterium]